MEVDLGTHPRHLEIYRTPPTPKIAASQSGLHYLLQSPSASPSDALYNFIRPRLLYQALYIFYIYLAHIPHLILPVCASFGILFPIFHCWYLQSLLFLSFYRALEFSREAAFRSVAELFVQSGSSSAKCIGACLWLHSSASVFIGLGQGPLSKEPPAEVHGCAFHRSSCISNPTRRQIPKVPVTVW